ncbi:MAG: hypothetical protein HPY78_02945 [Brevinematales bacterium]|nr:hypothetical protein [Brevinematales bacterium]
MRIGYVFLAMVMMVMVFFGSERPMKMNWEQIPSKWYIRYSVWEGKKQVGYMHVVYIVEKEDQRVFLKSYMRMWYPDKKQGEKYLPSEIRAFRDTEVFDMTRSQVLESWYVAPERGKEAIPAGSWLTNRGFLDVTNGIFFEEVVTWNGYEGRVSRGRCRVDTNVGVLNYKFLVYHCPVGFFDFEGGGTLQMAMDVLKTAIKGEARLKEGGKIDTPSGSYDTWRVEWVVKDPLMKILWGRWMYVMGSYWVDKKTRMTVKRVHETGMVYLLDEYAEFDDYSALARRVNSWMEREGGQRLAPKER